MNSTLDLSVAMSTIVQAFVSYKGPGGPAHVFKNASSWQAFTKSFCVGVQTLTGDAILIYRCWYIWSKSWLVIGVPALLWLATFVCQIGILVFLRRLGDGQVNSGDVLPWGLAFWTFTICTNILTTSLIVWRIWGVEKQSRKLRSRGDSSLQSQPESTLTRALRNIVESGMIYTAASILELAAFTSQSTLNYPASALAFYSVGITFNLIIIRGSAHRSLEASQIHFVSDTVHETPVHFSEPPGTNGHFGDDFRSTIDSTHDKPEAFVLAGLAQDSVATRSV